MLKYLWSWFGEKPSEVCQRDLPQVYGGFVDYLVDTFHSRAPIHGKALPFPSLQLPAADRLIAIGDLHGDFEKTRRAFRTAGLIDENDRWCGGTTTAVQVGDQLDRGDDEVRVLYFLERLQHEAAKQGGALHILTGNHETMNVAGRFRYSTPGGMDDFARWAIMQGLAAKLKASCGCGIAPGPAASGLESQSPLELRAEALSPGGPAARRFLAAHPTVLQIGSTLFVHGGVLPQHAEYGLERINEETRAWIAGEGSREMPRFLGGRDAVVWARDFSQEDERRCDCEALAVALAKVPAAERMVVGHTIQGAGVNSACGNRVYRVDVGLSRGCGDGQPEVLEILGDKEVRSLRESGEVRSFTTPKPPQQQPADRPLRLWQWWRQEEPAVAAAAS